jgi:hypothetical protein
MVALALLALGAGGSGCGEEGVANGATVHVYVGAGLCAAARLEIERQGPRAGEVNVQVECLDRAETDGRIDLATIGANARRATEDSTSIAYVEPPGPANRFSRTIVEGAGIAWAAAPSGNTAIKRILNAVSEAGSGSLRNEVRDALESP